MRFFSARFLEVADKDSCCNSILALSQLDVASGNCRQPIHGLWNARSAQVANQCHESLSIPSAQKKRPRLSAAEITGK